MSLAAHIVVGTALAAMCADGIIAAGYLVRGWRLPGFRDGAGSKERAMAGIYLAVWALLNFGPWLAGWNGTIVLATTLISLVPLIAGLRLLKRGIPARKRKGDNL